MAQTITVLGIWRNDQLKTTGTKNRSRYRPHNHRNNVTYTLLESCTEGLKIHLENIREHLLKVIEKKNITFITFLFLLPHP